MLGYSSRQTGKTLYFGRRRDHFDPRDFIWQRGSHLLTMAGPAPTKIDVTAGISMPAKFDQAQEGSCTANAGIRWRIWLEFKTPKPEALPTVMLSRQAQYAWERLLPWNNDLAQDSGANSRDIFVVLAQTGACPETDDPYEPATLYQQPSAQAIADAVNRKIGAYHRLTSLDDIKSCLLSGYALTMGFQVYESFENVGASGIWSPNVSKEQVIGGHETFCRGFDDSVNGGSLLFDNSWGESWGEEGSFWMPYSFVNDFAASQWDAWTGHLGPALSIKRIAQK